MLRNSTPLKNRQTLCSNEFKGPFDRQSWREVKKQILDYYELGAFNMIRFNYGGSTFRETYVHSENALDEVLHDLDNEFLSDPTFKIPSYLTKRVHSVLGSN